jgi:hypothetical protein
MGSALGVAEWLGLSNLIVDHGVSKHTDARNLDFDDIPR